MAILPTQDSEMKERLTRMFFTVSKASEFTTSEKIARQQSERVAEMVLEVFEKWGYYKGLPSNIEEALNSGDGVYRP